MAISGSLRVAVLPVRSPVRPLRLSIKEDAKATEITRPGLINLDFADVRTVMTNGGVAMIGMGEAEGEEKAKDSVMKALRSPLLDVDVSGASSALVNVVGGPDMTITDAETVVDEVCQKINPDARIIWGAQVDPNMESTLRAMLVVTGVSSPQILGKDLGSA